MGYTTKKIRKEIEKKEERLERKLNPKERRKIERKVKRQKIRRNRIIAILGALGVATIGGHALLTDGNKAEIKENKVKIENQYRGKSTRDEYIQELRNFEKNEQNINKNEDETKIVQQILDEYNSNLEEEQKINKDELGIILQEQMGEGHIIKKLSKDGKISYIEDYSKGMENLEEGQEWVQSEDINSVLILVDNKSKNTIAGICEINGEYCEIDAEKIQGVSRRTEYKKNKETYVGIPEEVNTKDVYKNFSKYYQERLERQQKIEKEDMTK